MSDVQRRTDSFDERHKTLQRKFYGKFALVANGIVYCVTGEEEEAQWLGRRAFGEGNYTVEPLRNT